MSRGLGQLQRILIHHIRAKPGLTWAELRGEPLHPTHERSLRRALRRLVDDKVVMIQGSGGRRDPFRYVIHPAVLVGTGDREAGGVGAPSGGSLAHAPGLLRG